MKSIKEGGGRRPINPEEELIKRIERLERILEHSDSRAVGKCCCPGMLANPEDEQCLWEYNGLCHFPDDI